MGESRKRGSDVKTIWLSLVWGLSFNRRLVASEGCPSRESELGGHQRGDCGLWGLRQNEGNVFWCLVENLGNWEGALDFSTSVRVGSSLSLAPFLTFLFPYCCSFGFYSDSDSIVVIIFFFLGGIKIIIT